IDLLSDLHTADFGGNRGPYLRNHQKGGNGDPEFAQDKGACEAWDHLHRVHDHVHMPGDDIGRDHPSDRRGNDDQGQTSHTALDYPSENLGPAPGPMEGSLHCLAKESGKRKKNQGLLSECHEETQPKLRATARMESTVALVAKSASTMKKFV